AAPLVADMARSQEQQSHGADERGHHPRGKDAAAERGLRRAGRPRLGRFLSEELLEFLPALCLRLGDSLVALGARVEVLPRTEDSAVLVLDLLAPDTAVGDSHLLARRD